MNCTDEGFGKDCVLYGLLFAGYLCIIGNVFLNNEQMSNLFYSLFFLKSVLLQNQILRQ